MRQSLSSSPDLAEFASLLTPEIEEEYRCILAPYGLQDHASELAAGRLMRSRLAAVAAGDVSDRLIWRCTALELLHTSTLIHDDILDHGSVRRGVPTLWKSVGLERALLIGNLVSTRALAIANADSTELAGAFIEVFQRVNAAQLRESHERGLLKARAVHQAINIGKVSALIELGLIVGVRSSTLWPVDLTHLRDAVREFGICFQIADDVEDIQAWLGGPEPGRERSKTADSDMELGNFTLPVTLLLGSADGDHSPGDPVSPQTLQSISRRDWESCLETALRLASDHFQRAQWHLEMELATGSGAEVSRRVADWMQKMIETWRQKGLDATLSGLPQQRTAR